MNKEITFNIPKEVLDNWSLQDIQKYIEYSYNENKKEKEKIKKEIELSKIENLRKEKSKIYNILSSNKEKYFEDIGKKLINKEELSTKELTYFTIVYSMKNVNTKTIDDFLFEGILEIENYIEDLFKEVNKINIDDLAKLLFY